MSTAPPSPPGPAPLHAYAMLLGEQRLLERCRKRYGDVFSLKFGWPFKRLVVLADPDEVKRVFTGDPELLHGGESNITLEPLVGLHSILLLDESSHISQRKLLLPPFHGERMQVYGELMREITEAEMTSWPMGEPFALLPSMQAITLRVICRAVFGVEDAERLSRFESVLTQTMLLASRVLMVPQLQRNLGRFSPWNRFVAARSQADQLILNEIGDRRKDADLSERSDILSLLLRARDEDGNGLGNRQLRDELMTLLVAGHETTATQLSWTFERLLRHQSVLAKLRETLDDGEEDYLDCVIKESQRSRPVLTYSALRKVTAPTKIGAYTIERGWTLGASAWLIHHRPDLYPDPESFRPERFAGGPAGTYSWIPFGGGVRRCLGAAFATFEMKVVLKTVLERCQLEATDQRPEGMRRRAITFVPAKGARAMLSGDRG